MLRHFTRNISLILFWLHVLMSHFVILTILILTRYDKGSLRKGSKMMRIHWIFRVR